MVAAALEVMDQYERHLSQTDAVARLAMAKVLAAALAVGEPLRATALPPQQTASAPRTDD